MIKKIFGVFRWGVLLCAVLALGWTKTAWAEVNFNISIGPPPVVVAEPPGMVLVPGSEVYFAPGKADIFFYHGYWWAPRSDRWYRARAHNGPWSLIDRRLVPGPVYGVPRDYRARYARERHIPYGQWKKEHWERGAREGWHEEKHEQGREGQHEEHEHDRGHGRED